MNIYKQTIPPKMEREKDTSAEDIEITDELFYELRLAMVKLRDEILKTKYDDIERKIRL